ncbi:hypothetical protein Lal_00034012 [Lupinus albus]|nr:hypothetical protein Lal_00034012 [Lupinus albus]
MEPSLHPNSRTRPMGEPSSRPACIRSGTARRERKVRPSLASPNEEMRKNKPSISSSPPGEGYTPHQARPPRCPAKRVRDDTVHVVFPTVVPYHGSP